MGSRIYGLKMFDWSKINDIAHPDDKKKHIIDCAKDLMRQVNSMPLPVEGAKVQGADSTLQTQNPVVLIQTDTLKAPDRGYEALFDEVDMRSSANGAFDIMDITGGVTFYQVKEGEEAKLSKLPTAALATVRHLRFMGGFNILDSWLRFNEHYKIDELTSDTIRRWYDKKATIFYALISALTAIDQAFSTDDTTTINNACANILTDLAAAGYAVDENAAFYVLCHPLLRMRVYKALAASFANPNTNNNQLVNFVKGVISSTKMASTHYWVILPGGKMKRGEWADLGLETQRDILKGGETQVWAGMFNGAIGDKRQVKKCALA